MADREARGPSGLPVVGSALDYAADPLGFMEECARYYGDCVRFQTTNGEVRLLTDPEAIEHVLAKRSDNYVKPDFGGEGLDGLLGDGLLTSEGERWAEQRKRIQPAFFRPMLDQYAETMVADARELAEAWTDSERVDIDEAMSQLTLRIIVETVLGTELGGMERAISDALVDVSRRFRADEVRSLVPKSVPTPRNLKYRRGERRLERIVRDIIRQHERASDTPAGDEASGGDMLSLLLSARDAGADINDETLRDQVLTMLLAGHDTTALTLVFSWYLLSEHPDVERRFHAELDEVLDDRDPTAADAADLDYTEQVAKEAMRLYPPAYTIYREAVEDDSVAGYHVPGGSLVSMPQWVVHRDPRWWDDPDTFRPERWADESSADRPEYAYYPFGGGPRKCIGGAFAMREAKLVLATLGRRYSLRYLGDGPPKLTPMVTLHPEPPVEFELRAR